MSTTQSLLGAFAAVNLACAAFAAEPAGPAASPPTRQVRLGMVDLSAPLPGDLLSPEGKSRWDLRLVPLRKGIVRSLSETAEGIVLQDDAPGAVLSNVLYKDDKDAVEAPAGARRWLFPDRFPDLLRPGAGAALDFIEERDGRQ